MLFLHTVYSCYVFTIVWIMAMSEVMIHWCYMSWIIIIVLIIVVFIIVIKPWCTSFFLFQSMISCLQRVAWRRVQGNDFATFRHLLDCQRSYRAVLISGLKSAVSRSRSVVSVRSNLSHSPLLQSSTTAVISSNLTGQGETCLRLLFSSTVSESSTHDLHVTSRCCTITAPLFS